MKTIEKFTEKKRTDKAVLISAYIEETGREETFWLPLSRLEITGQTIKIEVELWDSKLVELKEPTEKLVQVESSVYDKGEKATRLVVDVLFKDNEEQLFIWVPNSQVFNLEAKKNDEDRNIYIVSVPEWVWISVYQSSVDKQLEFWNKNEQKYTRDDFKLLSRVQ